jgi:hypothetical protein
VESVDSRGSVVPGSQGRRDSSKRPPCLLWRAAVVEEGISRQQVNSVRSLVHLRATVEVDALASQRLVQQFGIQKLGKTIQVAERQRTEIEKKRPVVEGIVHGEKVRTSRVVRDRPHANIVEAVSSDLDRSHFGHFRWFIWLKKEFEVPAAGYRVTRGPLQVNCRKSAAAVKLKADLR